MTNPHKTEDALWKAFEDRARDRDERLEEFALEAGKLREDAGFVRESIQTQILSQILQAMKETGLNANQLAKRLGKSRQYVSQLLNDRVNFTVQTLAELAVALGHRFNIKLVPYSMKIKEQAPDVEKRRRVALRP